MANPPIILPPVAVGGTRLALLLVVARLDYSHLHRLSIPFMV